MVLPSTRLAVVGMIVTLGAKFSIYVSVVINPTEQLFKKSINISFAQTYNISLNEQMFSYVWGVVVAIMPSGALIGVFIGPYISEHYGRKANLLLSNIPCILGIILMCWSWDISSVELLILGRFLVGFHRGLCSVATSLYLIEISPTKVRGIMGSFEEVFICFACAVGMIVGVPEIWGTEKYVYILLILPLVPVIVQSFLLIAVPDSPKHLLLTKLDESAAEKSLIFYHGKSVDLNAVKKEYLEEKQLQTGESMTWTECLSNSYIRRGFLVGILANMASMLTGISAVFVFSTELFHKSGVPLNYAAYATMTMAIVNFFASVGSSMFLIGNFGRRPLMLISLSGCLLCHILFVFCSFLRTHLGWQLAPHVAVSSLIIRVIVFSIGAGPLATFFSAELVPQAARSKAQAFAACSRWTGDIIDGIVFYPLFSLIGVYALLLTSIVPSTVCLIFLYFYMPESRDKTVSTIFAEYGATKMATRKK